MLKTMIFFPRPRSRRRSVKAFPPVARTNDILERFVPRFVVSLKCVCYIQSQGQRVNRETHI